MNEHFGDVLKEYVSRAKQTADRLAQLTDLPKQTIISWLNGSVKRPREWQPIVQIAVALRLYEDETNRLLTAAHHPALTTLLAQVTPSEDDTGWRLLESWRQRHSTIAPQSPTGAGPAFAPPFQAPPQPRTFYARPLLLAAITKALTEPAATCLVHGMGGVGKTTIATHLAYALRHTFPDGVLWANLGQTVSNEQIDPAALSLIANTFTKAFGRDMSDIDNLPGRSSVLREVLANKRILMVLDNAPGTAAVQPLLPPSTSGCAVLITSRNRQTLHESALPFEVNAFDEAESQAFFAQLLGTQRVQAHQPVIAQIADFLGGLPLALKIVASDLSESTGLTFQEYFTLLKAEESRLDPLVDWEHAPNNVRASFALSYNRLPPELQRLFTLLAFFQGFDFSADAVAALTAVTIPLAKKALARLFALSLIEQSKVTISDHSPMDEATRQRRYLLHPLIKAFAQEKFQAEKVLLNQPLQQVVAYFVWLTQTNCVEGYEAILRDRENIVGALLWAKEQEDWESFAHGVSGLTTVNAGVIGALDAGGYWQQTQDLLESLRQRPLLTNDLKAEAEVLFKLGAFAFRQSDLGRAEKLLNQSRALLTTQLIDYEADEQTLFLLAYICEFKAQLMLPHNPTEALAQVQQGIQLLASLPGEKARQEAGYLQIRRGSILARLGQLPEAQEYTRLGLQQLSNRPTSARISGLTNLGIIAAIQGNSEEAIHLWNQGVEDAKALGDTRRLADLWSNLGAAESRRGRFTAAVPYKQQALALYTRMGDIRGEIRICLNLGEDHLFLQRWQEAQQQLALAVDLSRYHQQEESELLALLNQVQLDLCQNYLNNAETNLQRVKELCQRTGAPEQKAEMLRLHAELAYQQQQTVDAISFIKQALELSKDRKEQGTSWRLYGNILSQAQQTTAAEEAYAQSKTLFSDYNEYELAHTLLAWAKHQWRNQPQPARLLLEQAHAIFTQLDITALVTETTTLLSTLQAHSDNRPGIVEPPND